MQLLLSTTQTRGVAVVLELEDSNLHPSTWHVLNEGLEVANKLDTILYVITMGYQLSSIVDSLRISKEKAQLIVLDDIRLQEYNEEIYQSLLEQIIEQIKPEVILMGATFRGKSQAAILAAYFETGITADCTELEVDKENRLLIQRRPAVSGQILAEIICPVRRPQIATLQLKMIEKKQDELAVKPKIYVPELEWSVKSRFTITKLRNLEKESYSERITIGVGIGIGSKDNLYLVKKLADKMGAAIGASKAVVDKGWLNYESQIGQTGRCIASDIYIACGISGAAHHMVGLSGVKKIIAINTDENAPIFNMSDYAIVGDVKEVISMMIQEIDVKAGEIS